MNLNIARELIPDDVAAEIIQQNKIEIGMDDDRHPTVFIAEAIVFALALREEIIAEREARHLGAISCQSSNPYFA